MNDFQLTYSSVDDVTSMIIDKFRKREPVSLMRFVHCEPRFLGYPVFFDRRNIDWSLELQLGNTNFSSRQLMEIADGMREAFRSSDIVGIPPSRPMPGNYSGQENYGQFLEASVAKTAAHFGLFRDGQRYVSHNIHLNWLTSNEYSRILKAAQKISIISGRDVATDLSNAFGIEVVEDIRVPSEAAFRTSNEDFSQEHFPDLFDELRTRLNRPQDGKVFVIGAGFLGKIYGSWIRKNGGSVIDIGSIFDIWANIPSRSGHTKTELEKYSLKKVLNPSPGLPQPEKAFTSNPDIRDRKVFDRIKNQSKIWSIRVEQRRATGMPSASLLDIFLRASSVAISKKFNDCRFSETTLSYLNTWPGEHYRLLAALVECIGARKVAVIGHHDGITTTSILRANPTAPQITHFAIPSAIESVREQVAPALVNIVPFRFGEGDPFSLNAGILQTCDIIVLGGDLQVADWRSVIATLSSSSSTSDTRQIAMLNGIGQPKFIEFWNAIDQSKLDVSGLGHWTGTGLVEF